MSGMISRLLEQVCGSWPAAGAAVCVLDAAGGSETSTSGYADVAKSLRIEHTTRFEIGSISKVITGLVIMQLVDEGKLRLTDRITDHLPWFDVQSEHEPITVRDLLHHTSGLIAGSDIYPDAIAHVHFLRHTQTGSAPGAMFHYSNVGFITLGLIIEALTGGRLADAITSRILQPLGMDHSSASVTAGLHDLLATGYQSLDMGRPLLPGGRLIPATWLETDTGDGNATATASDLGRLARLLLNGGTLDGHCLLSRAGFDQMIGDLAVGGEPSPYPSNYGLGINVECIDGHTCLTHGGGMVGYSSFLAVDLDANCAVAALTNAPGEFGVGELIARRCLNYVRTGNTDFEAVGRAHVGDAARYVGTFADDRHRIEVLTDSAGLLRLGSGGTTGTLYETGQGRLACDHPQWSTFPHRLTPAGGGKVAWTYGHILMHPTAESQATVGKGRPQPATGTTAALIGRYRSYSPWYPEFRVVPRSGRLVLIASAGVEAPTDEPELVPVDDGVYRVGADPRMPERLTVGPVVDGRVIWVNRDGCRYTRAFLE